MSQPPVMWRFTGNQLKRWHTRANVSRVQLAAASNYSPDTIKAMEQGVRMPTARVLDVADELRDAGELLSAAKEYLAKAKKKFPARAREFMEREREAISIWWYEIALIPGLLQTERYARTLIEQRKPPLDDETIQERITARMERQAIVTERQPPVDLSFVLYEAVLRSPLVDAEQLIRLLEVSRLRNVTLQVSTFERAVPSALVGSRGPRRHPPPLRRGAVSVQEVPVGAPWRRGGDAMTPRTEHRPQMSVEEFEELARHAPESVRLEFPHGKVQVGAAARSRSSANRRTAVTGDR